MHMRAIMDADAIPHNTFTDSAIITCHSRTGNAPLAVAALIKAHERIKGQAMDKGGGE